MPAAQAWRGRWDRAGLLLRRADHSERGNHPGWFPAAGIQPSWPGQAHRPLNGPGGAEPP